jgi:hypothetical protein
LYFCFQAAADACEVGTWRYAKSVISGLTVFGGFKGGGEQQEDEERKIRGSVKLHT